MSYGRPNGVTLKHTEDSSGGISTGKGMLKPSFPKTTSSALLQSVETPQAGQRHNEGASKDNRGRNVWLYSSVRNPVNELMQIVHLICVSKEATKNCYTFLFFTLSQYIWLN